MTEQSFKCSCGYEAESKFALKKHKRVCWPDAKKDAYLPKERPSQNSYQDRAALAQRQVADRQGFTEPYRKANWGRYTDGRAEGPWYANTNLRQQ